MGMKEIYQEKADAQLRDWQMWIENYKSDPTVARKPGDRQRMAERLDDCQRIAQIRLKELSASKAEHWELAKQAVERAMIDLKQVLDESGAANAGRFLQLDTLRSHIYEPFHRKG